MYHFFLFVSSLWPYKLFPLSVICFASLTFSPLYNWFTLLKYHACEFRHLISYLCQGCVERVQTGSRSDTRQRVRELSCFQPFAQPLFPLCLMLSAHRVIAQFQLHWSTLFLEPYSETKRGGFIKLWVLSLLCTELLQVTRGHRLFGVSCSIKWQISRSHPKPCKNMDMHMNSPFSYSCRETGAEHFLACRKKKVRKTGWSTVSSATSVYITNIPICSCMRNHTNHKPPRQALSAGGTNQPCVSVWIRKCSSHFPKAFELWINVWVSATIMRSEENAMWN